MLYAYMHILSVLLNESHLNELQHSSVNQNELYYTTLIYKKKTKTKNAF